MPTTTTKNLEEEEEFICQVLENDYSDLSIYLNVDYVTAKCDKDQLSLRLENV